MPLFYNPTSLKSGASDFFVVIVCKTHIFFVSLQSVFKLFMATLDFFWRWKAWLRRCGHSRGFGIQSPTAYQFVTDVLCQCLPYYAYDELSKQFPKLRGKELKFCRLLFRLANYQQAKQTFIASSFPEENLVYLLEGNRRSELVPSPENCDLIVVSASDIHDFDSFMDSVSDNAMIVFHDIYFHGREVDIWRLMKASKCVAMTFDCYDCGVVILGQTMHPSHYLVNL